MRISTRTLIALLVILASAFQVAVPLTAAARAESCCSKDSRHECCDGSMARETTSLCCVQADAPLYTTFRTTDRVVPDAPSARSTSAQAILRPSANLRSGVAPFESRSAKDTYLLFTLRLLI